MNKNILHLVLKGIILLIFVYMIYTESGVYTASFCLIMGVLLELLRLMFAKLLKDFHSIKSIVMKACDIKED